MPLLDAAKGIACLVIVAHHLTRYGPLPEVALPLAPGLIGWLSNDGRLAVQVFLVLGGFLAAASLAPDGLLRVERPALRIAQRYGRLVLPYLAALSFCVLVAAVVRPWLQHDAVPAAPTWRQLLAHGLLLQDLLGHEALSTGVWYVAIDFQLFTLALLLLAGPPWLQRRWQWPRERARALAMLGVLALAAASLALFNRQTDLDDTALYYFGAYALGMLAFWIGRAERLGLWLLGLGGLLLLGGAALALEWRIRVAIALVAALTLVMAQRLGWLRPARLPAAAAPWLWLWLGTISYSLFLVHFPVILAVNALVSQLWPAQAASYALGMLAALALSIAAAALLYRLVEARRPSWQAVLAWFAALLACGGLAAHLG